MNNRANIPPGSILRRILLFFKMIQRTSDDYYFATDLQENLVIVSANMVNDFEVPSECFYDMNKYWTKLVHPDDLDGFVESIQMPESRKLNIGHDYEYRLRTRKGDYIWVRCRGQFAFDNRTEKPFLFAGTVKKLGQRNHADELTGLLNKYQFENAVKVALNRYRVDGVGGALMVFGIDNFKIVNETYNRHYGDEVLKLAARHISDVLPEGLMLYKMDGDEFAVVCPGLSQEGAIDVFENVQKAFSRPHSIEGKHIFCTISSGTVLYPQAGKDYLVLHKHAEAALDLAKRDGKNKNVIFSKESYNRWKRSLSMRDDLRLSIESDFEGFSLFYQPQVSAQNNKIIGAEALLRWRNPKGRMVSPMEFIRILEDTKMIIPVGRWIFETAVRQCKEWQKFNPGMTISINLSYEQIKEAYFKDFVVECLKKYDLNPELIVLELTETTIVSDWSNINQQFDKLRSCGIRIAMDDFGTGYSSLAYLKNLSCDIVKIDRLFVTHITEEDNHFDRQLVGITVDLCHSVNIKCCIEGVETEDEYKLLRDICHADTIQGYLFGRPESPEDFESKYFMEDRE
ncbi:MAG: GGDEF and EAL domain-containing protein [Anaerovibrio sp.]|nr:GGDEF and EAL domain-containing protein [Anaerovibrio sp.]